jgi:hypothetical protein
MEMWEYPLVLKVLLAVVFLSEIAWWLICMVKALPTGLVKIIQMWNLEARESTHLLLWQVWISPWFRGEGWKPWFTWPCIALVYDLCGWYGWGQAGRLFPWPAVTEEVVASLLISLGVVKSKPTRKGNIVFVVVLMMQLFCPSKSDFEYGSGCTSV